MPVQKKIPQKRGRKAKVTKAGTQQSESKNSDLKVYSASTKTSSTADNFPITDDVIILHLNIKLDDNGTASLKAPMPYSSMGYEYEHFSENMKKKTDEIMEDFYKQPVMSDKDASAASIQIANKLDYSGVNNTTMNRVIDSMVEFIEAKKNKKWPQHVNIACFWCSEFFDTIPIGIPVKVITKKTGTGKKQQTKNTYYCEDNYCTFECAVADLFKQKRGNFRERYSLLCNLYKEAHNLPRLKKVKSALPLKTLERYGGPLSIDKFREYSKIDEVVYTVVDPPMIPVISQLESNYMEFNVASRNNSFIPINKQVTDPNSQQMHSAMKPRSHLSQTGIHQENTLLKFITES